MPSPVASKAIVPQRLPWASDRRHQYSAIPSQVAPQASLQQHPPWASNLHHQHRAIPSQVAPQDSAQQRPPWASHFHPQHSAIPSMVAPQDSVLLYPRSASYWPYPQPLPETQLNDEFNALWASLPEMPRVAGPQQYLTVPIPAPASAPPCYPSAPDDHTTHFNSNPVQTNDLRAFYMDDINIDTGLFDGCREIVRSTSRFTPTRYRSATPN
ncbi:hypothetical protein JB92DRAFT_2915821 [Gautieria morchelliformis]|nr:hypothetical protein JB92DRAFT_2915821 [Gautieria morchelliformis]